MNINLVMTIFCFIGALFSIDNCVGLAKEIALAENIRKVLLQRILFAYFVLSAFFLMSAGTIYYYKLFSPEMKPSLVQSQK